MEPLRSLEAFAGQRPLRKPVEAGLIHNHYSKGGGYLVLSVRSASFRTQASVGKGSQKAQYPLIKDDTLNHIYWA